MRICASLKKEELCSFIKLTILAQHTRVMTSSHAVMCFCICRLWILCSFLNHRFHSM